MGVGPGAAATRCTMDDQNSSLQRSCTDRRTTRPVAARIYVSPDLVHDSADGASLITGPASPARSGGRDAVLVAPFVITAPGTRAPEYGYATSPPPGDPIPIQREP